MTRPSLLRRRRGFTLVELMVATTAGLTVALGAFAFARAATRSFQQETRLADATGNATIGFRRLVSDLERAGYLSPSNIQREFSNGNRVCLQPNNAFSPAIQSLASLTIEQGPTPTTGTVPNSSTHTILNGPPINLDPDRLTLAGSYVSTELFPVRSIDSSGSSPVVYLERNSGAAMRLMNGNTTPVPWSRTFRAGRILRIVDREGYQHFGHITGIDASGAYPQITLKSTPGLYMRGQPAPTVSNPLCKGFDIGTGSVAGVVDRIRYEVRDLRNVPQYQALYPANPVLPEDAQRWELVRYELDENNNLLAGTEELVAEFAIDLKFALTVISDPTLDPINPNPTLQFLEFGNGTIGGTYARPVVPGNVLPGPERIRSVRVRFSVRSREPDRAVGINPAQVGALPGTLFRYQIPGSTKYARVRTLHADVSMSNQMGLFF
jgi:prepilin-type N-terminal cleavage/methylation domain-containing protein